MAQQTITISYVSAFTSGLGSANTTVTVNVPTGIDPTQHVRNGYLSGGFWTTSATGSQLFIPANQVFQITSP
jgi:hypothetical protein